MMSILVSKGSGTARYIKLMSEGHTIQYTLQYWALRNILYVYNITL